MTDKIVVLTTCETAAQANQIAHQLVELRLAACVNIMPGVNSVYRWKGKVEESTELILVIKSRRELFAGVRAEIEKLHSAEVPEIVALPIVEGSELYLSWMDHELGPAEG